MRRHLQSRRLYEHIEALVSLWISYRTYVQVIHSVCSLHRHPPRHTFVNFCDYRDYCALISHGLDNT